MIRNVEGYPVGIFSLSESEIESLQEHYLQTILGYDEHDIKPNKISASRVSVTKYGKEVPPEFFKKFEETIQKYVDEYVDLYNFRFNKNVEFIESWYNVHKKHDHQSVHDHISNASPTFACNLILKQPNDKSGQLVFMTPNISNHLKYLQLDPFDDWSNVFKPEMKDGELFIFPTCMQHFVQNNQTDEDRVVMVTNIKVTRKDF
jgi:hypothetical protein